MIVYKLIPYFIFIALRFSVVGSAENIRKFPDGFRFGVSSAAYQIEGAWNTGGKSENIWDRLCHEHPEMIKNGSSGDIACDSYKLWKRDAEMVKDLGVDFYRFSISWSRLLPSGFDDKLNPDGVSYYNNLIDELIRYNVTPVVTLYHWDLPQRLQDLGGWANPFLADYFANYARFAFQIFGDRVKDWLTFNEPEEICYLGYGQASRAPALNFHGVGDYLCGHTLLLAHAKAYHVYDDDFRKHQNGRVSISLNSIWAEDDSANKESAKAAMEFHLGWFSHPIYSKAGDYPDIMKERVAKRSQEQGFSYSRLPSFKPDEVDFIRGTSDFFGLNHYTSRVISPMIADDKRPVISLDDDCGVEFSTRKEWKFSRSSTWLMVVPSGLRNLLNWIKNQYDSPEIMILESGYSDGGELEDVDRIEYYRGYMGATLDAIADGCNVTGYSAWSLMDNFEWLEGYNGHFGLYAVDMKDPNKTRTPKASVKFFQELSKNRQI